MPPALVLQCIMVVFLASSVFAIKEGVFDKIKNGLHNAKSYLEAARDIADLVSKSLRAKQSINRRGDDANFSKQGGSAPFEPSNFVSIFFRLFGLDSSKVTAIAVNSFIFLAQTISELFHLTPKIEHAKAVNEVDGFTGPIRLITESENEKVKRLLELAKDKELPSFLMKQADNYDSSCIKLLLCKISPFILAAQKSLENGPINGRRDITSWLPSKDEFEEEADLCDNQHRDCELNFSS